MQYNAIYIGKTVTVHNNKYIVNIQVIKTTFRKYMPYEKIKRITRIEILTKHPNSRHKDTL
jgi:hypothetical protein